MPAAPLPEGLDAAEAARRLRRDGPNVLPAAPGGSLARLVARVLTQPMFLLLIATAALYALLGSATDAALLGVSVLLVGGLTVFQERRTERVLEALKDLSSPRCTVVREGRMLSIASRDVVRGDRLIVNEGDRLSVDARLLEAAGLRVDESQRTGEPVPLDKSPGGAGDSGWLFAGSLVVQGEGTAEVARTGAHTLLGAIHGSIALLTPRDSRLQRELRRLVVGVAWLAAFTCLAAAAVFAQRDGSWTQGLLVGLTLAMSLIPEEFAVVWSVMLAIGAWRLARLNVLTRQPQAIEALGTTTVLCVDKTGTLTHNRMTLVALHDGDQSIEPGGGIQSPGLRRLLAGARRASGPEGIEPMDQAVRAAARAAGLEADESGWTPGPHRGIRAGSPMVIHWWNVPRGASRHVVVKGAPEAVLACCDADADTLRGLRETADRWSAQGLRVLAVAEGCAAGPGPGADAALPPAPRLEPLGLLGFADPLRAEVPAAIEECHAAGVRVIMITGDGALTARSIARDAGLVDDTAARVLTGAELDALDDIALGRCLREVSVFARIDPAQKLRIVQLLQQQGDVVAMTGDGVNDAPALKAAAIGVAMGRRGTDVAREAASLVLLDDNFASLVEAVRAGRRIFLNLRKALGYLFAVHVPIVGVALMPVVLGGPVLLLPLHVVLLELLIDPACSLVFEAEAAPEDGMRVPPRPRDERLFPLATAIRALALGLLAFAGVAAVQGALRLWSDASVEELRRASLGSIVLGNLLLLVWFRAAGLARLATNPVFNALIVGVCLIWLALMLAPGAGALLGLPAESSPWAWAVLAPALWAAWQLAHRHGPGATAPRIH